LQINDCVIDWISNNHVTLPKLGEKIPTLMEEMAQREEAQRVVCPRPLLLPHD